MILGAIPQKKVQNSVLTLNLMFVSNNMYVDLLKLPVSASFLIVLIIYLDDSLFVFQSYVLYLRILLYNLSILRSVYENVWIIDIK